MNIMKTNMLLLDNKIMKEEPSNAPIVEAPVPSTVKNYSGMNALAFKGMQNLMANPVLAKEVGVMMEEPSEKDASAKSYVAPFSSNIAFKGGKVKTMAMAAALTAAAAAALTSCTKVEQDQKVEVNLDALAAAFSQGIARLEAQIEALMKQIKDQGDEQAARDAEMLKVLQNAYNQMVTMNSQLTAGIMSFEAFKVQISEENNAIIEAIAMVNNTTKEEARNAVMKILTALENHFIDENEAMAQIQALLLTNNELLGDILGVLKDLKASADEAKLQRDSLLSIANETKNEVIKNGKVSAYQRQIMINQLAYTIQQNNVQIANEYKIYNAIKKGTAKINATIYEVANDLGVKVDSLAEVISITGISIEEAMNMNKEEILEVLNAHLTELEEVNNNLINVDNSVKNNTITVEEAADEIADILNKISEQIDALSQQFAEAVKMFRNKFNALIKTAQGIYANGRINNSMLANLIGQAYDLRNDIKSIKSTALKIKQNLENGIELNTNIDYDKIEEMFKILNLHQQASKDEIIAKLDEFIDGQERIEIAIGKLGDENNANFKLIAKYIGDITPDNSEVVDAINNLAKANEENIAEAAELLAAKLDALLKAVNSGFDDLRDQIPTWKAYMETIIGKLDNLEEIKAAIKANGAKIDTTNMNTAELKAEVEKIKPYLEDLVANSKTANGYLEIIAQQAPEIAKTAKDIEAKLGRALTKDELEELWLQHDANAKTYIDALHLENLAKADEEIGYLKDGNKILLDIFNKLKDFAEQENLSDADMKKLLQDVYDYLPELICKCKCQADVDHNDTHEGAIGIITARRR